MSLRRAPRSTPTTNGDMTGLANTRHLPLPDGVAQTNGTHDIARNTRNVDDDGSSSLSEFEDEVDRPDVADQAGGDDEDDDDMSSQIVLRDGNDSEAETERLDDTPKANARLANNGATPSKLSQEAVFDDRSSDSQATPTGRPRTSSELAGRKRKRPSPTTSDRHSPASEVSESDRALAKRRLDKTVPQDDTLAETEDGVLRDEDRHELSLPALDHKMRGRSRSRRGKGEAEPASSGPAEPNSNNDNGGENNVPHDEGAPEPDPEAKVEAEAQAEAGIEAEDDDDDEDDDSDAITTEEAEKRLQAAKAFTDIAKQFSLWRNKFQAEKIAAAERELEELEQPAPLHQEYIAQMQCISARRDVRMRQDSWLHHYKRQALRNETTAQRSQLHSQYYQEARDIRDKILYNLGKDWYEIQRERRTAQADELDRWINVFPANRSEQLRQQTRYNTEVSILAGVAKYVGFPAAPDLQAARSLEMSDDLKAMKIPQKQATSQAPRLVPSGRALPRSQKSEQLAQQEFLEQTPWANPQHPIHGTPSNFGVPPTARQPPTAEPRRASVVSQHMSSPQFSSPVVGAFGKTDRDTRIDDSTGADRVPAFGNVSSSTIGAPQATNGNVVASASRAHVNDGSPVAAPRKKPGGLKEGNRLDSAGAATNATSKRDFSGLSSTSTIDAPPSGEKDTMAQRRLGDESATPTRTDFTGQHPPHADRQIMSATAYAPRYDAPRVPNDGIGSNVFASQGLRVSGLGGRGDMTGA